MAAGLGGRHLDGEQPLEELGVVGLGLHGPVELGRQGLGRRVQLEVGEVGAELLVEGVAAHPTSSPSKRSR